MVRLFGVCVLRGAAGLWARLPDCGRVGWSDAMGVEVTAPGFRNGVTDTPNLGGEYIVQGPPEGVGRADNVTGL